MNSGKDEQLLNVVPQLYSYLEEYCASTATSKCLCLKYPDILNTTINS